MKTLIAPRYVGALVWLLSVVLLAAGAWVYRSAGSTVFRAWQPAGDQVAADDARPINAGFRVLQDLQRASASMAGMAPGVADPVIAPAPLPLPKTATSATAGGPGAGSNASLIFLQTGRRSVALLDGQAIRAGQTLASGEVVEEVGRTYVILRTASGEKTRIDMQNRFNPNPNPALEIRK